MNISLSINPSYFCNFSCDFCYLTPAQLRDRVKLDLDVLHSRLIEVSRYFKITHVDLYGGEILALPTSYVNMMLVMIAEFCDNRINIVTNLSSTIRFDTSNVDISVSYDSDCRERHDLVERNMRRLVEPIHVLMLATQCLMSKDVDDIIRLLNDIPSVHSVEIKPYSTNQSNSHPISFVDFENFIKRWITSPVVKRFEFINDHAIRDSLYGGANAFSNDHLYITPSGDFAVLDFDLNDNEYFRSVNSIDEYIDWSTNERNRVFENSFCNKCPYLGRCLSEHLRNVQDVTNSCNGFKGLLDWYATVEN